MRPVDLKEGAKRFTEKYYPQWVSRVDRIWEMLEKIDPNSLQSEPGGFQYQQGNAFGIAGGVDTNFNECISGIAVFAFTYHGTKNDDEISVSDLQSRLTTSSLSANLESYPGLESKLKSILDGMLSSNAGEPSKAREEKFENAIFKDTGGETEKLQVHYQVWTKQGQNKVTQDVFLKIKRNCFLFVDADEGLAYSDKQLITGLKRHPQCLHILICLLKNKGIISVETLFKEIYPERKMVVSLKTIRKALRTPVSRLRKILEEYKIVLDRLETSHSTTDKISYYQIDVSVTFLLSQEVKSP